MSKISVVKTSKFLLWTAAFFVGSLQAKIDPFFPGADQCRDSDTFPKEHGQEFELLHENTFGPQ